MQPNALQALRCYFKPADHPLLHSPSLDLRDLPQALGVADMGDVCTLVNLAMTSGRYRRMLDRQVG